MRWVRSGLYFRFIVAMLALALVPATFLGFSLLSNSERGIQEAVLELSTKLAEKMAENIENYFQTVDEKLRFAINAVQKSGMGWPEKQDLLRSLIESHSDIEEISVLNRSGVELLKVYSPAAAGRPALGSRAKDPGYVEFRKTGRRTLWLIARPDQPPGMEVYFPLNPAVSLKVSLRLNRLWALVGAERVGGTGFAFVVGRGGEPLFYSPERLGAGSRASAPRLPIVRRALSAPSVGSSEFADAAGVMQVGAYAPVPSIGGAVVIQQPKADAYAAAGRMRKTTKTVFLVFGAAAFLIALWMARRLTRPLLDLTRAASQVAEGGFPGEVRLSTDDELQDLADTFNRMVAQLRKYSEMQVDRLVAEHTKTDSILFSINDGILMTDYDGRIQLANRRAKELLGVDPAAVLEGKTLPEAVESAALLETLAAAAAGAGKGVFKEIDCSTEQYRRILRVSAQPVVVPGKGTALGIVTAVRDVTIEKQLDRMKEEFLHSITHDLRNPVGSVIGFADFLLKGVVGVLSPQQASMVESIRKASTRLLAMVNNILDAAKMEDGKVEVRLKTVSLAGVAGHALDILGSLAQRRGLKMELDAAEEFSIQGDPDLLERVFANLIGNAIKFSAEDGRVTVHIRDDGACLKICVEDDGEGIPSSHIDKIFEKFEQVPGQRKGGTGLGLTICKHIVEAHLGRIWAESALGKGARFFFTLPKDLIASGDGQVTRRSGEAAPA